MTKILKLIDIIHKRFGSEFKADTLPSYMAELYKLFNAPGNNNNSNIKPRNRIRIRVRIKIRRIRRIE